MKYTPFRQNFIKILARRKHACKLSPDWGKILLAKTASAHGENMYRTSQIMSALDRIPDCVFCTGHTLRRNLITIDL